MVFDVIIIGGGPAGISASNYCHRLGLSTLLIYELFGGQVNFCDSIYSIPSAPSISSKRLLINYHKTVKSVRKVQDHVKIVKKKDDIFIIETENTNYFSKTIIACTGAKPKNLNSLINLSQNNIPILNYENFPFTMVKNANSVVIIGGGYVGLEIAHQIGESVGKVIILEKTNHLGGNQYRQNNIVHRQNVEIVFNSNLIEINDRLITYSNNTVHKAVMADFLITAHGIQPATEIFPAIVMIDNKGIRVNRTGENHTINMCPDLPGFFAAGDAVHLPINGFVSFAEGMGIETAKSSYYYVKLHE